MKYFLHYCVDYFYLPIASETMRISNTWITAPWLDDEICAKNPLQTRRCREFQMIYHRIGHSQPVRLFRR